MVELIPLLRAIGNSWGPDTAQGENWSPKNPAQGQCAVSTMVIHDYFGGKIVRGVTDRGTVHYWNEIEGAWVDASYRQFWSEYADHQEHIVSHLYRDEDYLWQNPDTVERYLILRERVEEQLDAASKGEYLED